MRDLCNKGRPNPDLLTESNTQELFNLSIECITPVFGGSDDTGNVDADRPVNAKLLRGHLRFWWRACNAHRFSETNDMFTEEESIWGSADKPSQIDVTVSITNNGNIINWEDERDFPKYALFPFQKNGNDPRKDPLAGLKFDLILKTSQSAKITDASKLKQQIEGALWAWVMFGGVGSRTRRGCGSIRCANKTDWNVSTISAYAKQFISSDVQNTDPGIPMLHGAKILTKSADKPIYAWSDAVDLMQVYRQGSGIGRNPGSDPTRSRKLGRSKWPEPDSLREISRQYPPKHSPVHEARTYFPRADLGLPIIFHFPENGEPRDAMLEVDSDTGARMASPAILKPIATSNGSAVAAIVMLNTPHVYTKNVVFHNGPTVSKSEMHDPIKDSKVVPLAGKPIRDALMDYAKKSKGFTNNEVTI